MCHPRVMVLTILLKFRCLTTFLSIKMSSGVGICRETATVPMLTPKYLQHFLSQELSESTCSKKLQVSSVVKAGLKIFAAETDVKSIQQMAALDVSIPCGSWGKDWSEASAASSHPDESGAHLARCLELDGIQLAKKIDVTMQVQEKGNEQQARFCCINCLNFKQVNF